MSSQTEHPVPDEPLKEGDLIGLSARLRAFHTELLLWNTEDGDVFAMEHLQLAMASLHQARSHVALASYHQARALAAGRVG